jgi:two-component SAPR family response regulator
VENENIIALDIKNILEKSGYEIVAVVNSGEKAIDIAEKESPDLITMNLKINGEIDGNDSASIISSRLNIPILFISANVPNFSKIANKFKRSLRAIRKPFRKSDLVEAIRDSLENSNLKTDTFKR